MSSIPAPTPSPKVPNSSRDVGDSGLRETTTVIQHSHSTSFSGPLPPPELLERYEQICPGYAERILKSFEAETDHRREMEKTIVDAQIRQTDKQFSEARLGQIFALLIALSSLAAGVYTAVTGHEAAASVLGLTGVGGIVTTFVLGRYKQQRKEHEDSSQPKAGTAPSKRQGKARQ